MNVRLFSLVGVLFLLFLFSMACVAVYFDKIQDRYGEIQPDLDNYSAGEIVYLSYEKLKTSLLKNEDEGYDEYKIKMQVFSSKIKILDNRTTLGSAFYKDPGFVKDLSELKKQYAELAGLNAMFFKGEINESQLLMYLDGMENTMINLQEDIYKVQISSFNEVTDIINGMLERAKWFCLLSVFLLFLIVFISTGNALRLKSLIKKKNLFISSIYHEVAGSAQSIVMAIDIIEHELMQNELKYEVQKISYHTDKIIEQTREVMDYARFELGTVRVDAIAVNVSDIIAEAVSMYSARGNNVFFLRLPKKGVMIETDKYKLTRIVMNTIDNANKYTCRGRVYINAKYINGALCFRVRDTGVGFNIKELKNLYKAFNQGAEKQTRQGLGLGLTIIKNYVGLLKGQMRVRSAINHGSIFFIRIPAPLVKK